MLSLAPTPALKSHLETQLNFMNDMSNKLCDSACRLSDIQLRMGRQAFEDSINTSRHMLQAQDPSELTSIALSQMQPLADNLRHYHQQVLGVLAGTQAELSRSAETHIPEASRTATAVADELVKRANEDTERAAQRQRERMSRQNGNAARPATGTGGQGAHA